MAIIAQNTFTLKRLAKDAVTYYLVPSVNIVRRSGTTNVPVSVSCVKMKQVGSDAAAVTTDHTLYKSIDGGADSVYSGAVTVGTANTITFRLKDGGGTVIASSTVVVLEDELFSKNDIAQQLGYADWAAMVAAKTGGNPIITAAGLINANIIDIDTLVALEAFITKVITRQLQSAADIRQSSILIHSPDPEDEDDEAYIKVGGTVYYIKLSVVDNGYGCTIPVITVRTNNDTAIDTLSISPYAVMAKTKTVIPGGGSYYVTRFTAGGIEVLKTSETDIADQDSIGMDRKSAIIGNGLWLPNLDCWSDIDTGSYLSWGTLYRNSKGMVMMYNPNAGYSSVDWSPTGVWFGTAITGTNTTATAFPSSGVPFAFAGDIYVNIPAGNIYKCITGGVPAAATWSYQGRPAYSASDVGALADNAIQYFTAAEWLALTTAQKNAIPLAVVGE